MDHELANLTLSSRFFVENREYEIRWCKQAKQTDVCDLGEYVMNEIMKIYQTDSLVMKDQEQQEYGLQDIISFQVKEIFVYIPHNKLVKTFLNTDQREIRSVIYFISPEKIKIEKFKQKNIKQESVFFTLAIIRKQNQGFEATLRQIVVGRLNNLQITDPSEHLQGTEERDEDQPSPKFGASPKVSVTFSAGENNDTLTGSSTVKKSQPITCLGTQQDYLKNQQHHIPHEIKGYTMKEVALHKSDNDIWTVINGKIYDVTHYLMYHPGGKDKLMQSAGRDGTELFNKYHPWVNAHFILQKNQVGFIVLK